MSDFLEQLTKMFVCAFIGGILGIFVIVTYYWIVGKLKNDK